MTEHDFEKQLAFAMAEEDACLSDETFVAEVMDTIRHSERTRKLVLGVAASAGAIIAGFQLPALIDAMSGISLIEEVGFGDLVTGLPTLSGLSNSVWMVVAGIIALTGVAVFSADRV